MSCKTMFPTTPRPGVVRIDADHSYGLGTIDIKTADIKKLTLTWHDGTCVRLKSGSRLRVRHDIHTVKLAIAEANDLSRFEFVEKEKNSTEPPGEKPSQFDIYDVVRPSQIAAVTKHRDLKAAAEWSEMIPGLGCAFLVHCYIYHCRHRLLRLLSFNCHAAPVVLKALKAGEFEGRLSEFVADIACVDIWDLPGFDAYLPRDEDTWLQYIKKGDTPQNCPVVAEAVHWIEEWLEDGKI